MNCHNAPSRLRPDPRRGFTLLELIVYIGVLLVISGIAMSSLNRLWSAAGHASASRL